MNILVTIKNEYLIRIKNLLTKIIYDGLNSIYVRTREVSNEEDTLKTFQSLLKRVPKWTDEILSNEVLRIRSVLELDNKYDLLSDLLKASIKSHFNIMTFGFDPEYDVNNLINNFSFKEFIKSVYIESSRDLYNNPFLFYHNYSPIDIKRNQRDVLDIIHKSIEEAIRCQVPIKIILQSYLKIPSKSFLVNYPAEVGEIEEDLVEKMVKDDLEKDIYKFEVPTNNTVQNINDKPLLNENNLFPNEVAPPNNLIEPIIEMNGGNIELPKNDKIEQGTNQLTKIQSNDSSIKILNSEVNLESEKKPVISEPIENNLSDNKSVNEKILEIINDKSLNLTNQTVISEFESAKTNIKENFSNTDNCNETFLPAKNDSASIKNVDGENKYAIDSHQSAKPNVSRDSNAMHSNQVSNSASNKMNMIKNSQSELDSKLEKLLKNDLGDSETDSTMVNDQSNYQEVFSNSNSSHDSSLNSQQKNDQIDRNKFFANYLNL